MPTIEETLRKIVEVSSWDQRIAQLRLIPQRHGTEDHAQIYSAIARLLYVPHLAPDFAYVHEAAFYDEEYFNEIYQVVEKATQGFTKVSLADLTAVIQRDARTLLVFRTITGLTRDEFAHSTKLVGDARGLSPISTNKVGSMERRGTSASEEEARLAATTLTQIMDGSLFGIPPRDLRTKQQKPDTAGGWPTVARFASKKVPYSTFLHQRHYGGAFRQILDATSTKRGDLIEVAVEVLFQENGIPYIRTGSRNQAEIADRFEVQVTPAPDFVVFDSAQTLRAMIECKGANDGGTARDKALRFERLREESIRLGGVPLLAVLGGMGWTRVNDTLGPVIRDTEGRVFTVATLHEMLEVNPFPTLKGLHPHDT